MEKPYGKHPSIIKAVLEGRGLNPIIFGQLKLKPARGIATDNTINLKK
ncbi:MAG: hypothetical protein ACM37W_00720 [Actinomycetota bacterium]